MLSLAGVHNCRQSVPHIPGGELGQRQVSAGTTGAYRRSHSETFRRPKGSRLSILAGGWWTFYDVQPCARRAFPCRGACPSKRTLTLGTSSNLMSLIRARVDGLDPPYRRQNATGFAHGEFISTSVSLSRLRGMLRDVFEYQQVTAH
jgi:hypothetical protein